MQYNKEYPFTRQKKNHIHALYSERINIAISENTDTDPSTDLDTQSVTTPTPSRIEIKYTFPGEQQDMKRARNRNLRLYSFCDIANIPLNHSRIRFVVTADFKLTLAEDGTPSSSLPNHNEMTEDRGCIAAGYIVFDSDKKIVAIINGCAEYHTDEASLVWLLKILFLKPELISQKIKIEQRIYKDYLGFDVSSCTYYINDLFQCLTYDCGVLETDLTANTNEEPPRTIYFNAFEEEKEIRNQLQPNIDFTPFNMGFHATHPMRFYSAPNSAPQYVQPIDNVPPVVRAPRVNADPDRVGFGVSLNPPSRSSSISDLSTDSMQEEDFNEEISGFNFRY